MVYCYECKKEFEHMNAFLVHHRWHHNMNTQEYYDKHLKKDGEGVQCKRRGCNNTPKFFSMAKGYFKYCSRNCSRKDPRRSKKMIDTRIERYGRAGPDEEKRKETCLKRYGETNVSRVEEFKLKREETTLRRHGYRTIFETEEHRQYMLNGGAAYCNSFIKNPSKPQVELFELCQEVLPYPIMNYPCLRYSIDIAIPSLGIAIEYDGSYWHDKENDKKRQNKLEREGWKFIRYEDRIPSKEELLEDINERMKNESRRQRRFT